MDKEGILIGRQWGWIMLTGFVYVILGVIAFSAPVETTIGLTIALAVLLLVGGALRFLQAYKLRHRNGAGLRFWQAGIALLVGALMLRYPEGGAMSLALALSFYFLLGATVQWLLAMSLPSSYGRGWGYVSAIASFVLGMAIILAFPSSAVWVPGALLGIDLIFAGAAMMGFASAVKRIFENQKSTVASMGDRFSSRSANRKSAASR